MLGLPGIGDDDLDSVVLSSDFELIDNPVDQTTYAIRIKHGEWSGVEVMYGQVSIAEDTDTQQGILKFTFQIIDPAEHNNSILEQNPAFTNKLGDILSFILYENLKTGAAEIGHIDTDTDTHS